MPEQQAFSCRNSFPHNHERSEVIDEMAKDEARHGKAFEGLLKRYFGK